MPIHRERPNRNVHLQKGFGWNQLSKFTARNSFADAIDTNGNLWLFGGNGTDSFGNVGALNDLWEYNPSANAWTWVGGFNALNDTVVYGTKGSASVGNLPGARQEAISWVDSAGNLWLFGGVGNASAGGVGVLNDLWKYIPSAKTWEWVSGSNEVFARSDYGTKGSTAPTIAPGARQDATAWIDSTNHLWMFGGYGVDSLGNDGDHNDLWQFSID